MGLHIPPERLDRPKARDLILAKSLRSLEVLLLRDLDSEGQNSHFLEEVEGF